MCVCVCVCVLKVMRTILNEVLWCIYVISSVNCALDRVYILFTLLFLYRALWAHVKCKRLIKVILFYSTL